MNHLWYRCCHWLCARVYFERITVAHPERLPDGGPALYVVLHRNGAVDGFVYHQLVPRGIYMISTQLLRSFFTRLFFSGIAVARSKDEEDGGRNEAALRECVQLLKDGGELMVFPEGTSSLGPRHLPFKSGAVRLALDALAQGVPLRIVPLGIHYERAWAFRSKVEVVVGKPVLTEFTDGLSDLGRFRELKRRVTSALESVGADFAYAGEQGQAERLAYVATLGTKRGYFASLKALEAGIPDGLLECWGKLESRLAGHRVLLHQGVPLFPVGSWAAYAVLLVMLVPLVLAGGLLNFPPLLAGWLAARKFADDRNVIALWRILVGLPLGVVWFVGFGIVLAWVAGWPWLLGYAVVTLAALKSLYRCKKLAVAVWNGLAQRGLAGPAREFHQTVLSTLPPP